MTEPEHIGCCIVVQNSDGEILLAKRKNGYKDGYYGLPGGRVEGQELLTDCAIRELAEETDLRAVKLEFAGVVREWQGEFSFVHFIFLCREWEGIPVNNEQDKAEPWQWYKMDALPDPVLPGHYAGLKLINSPEAMMDLV
jgi:8-oxo-dGTP diphosphatase